MVLTFLFPSVFPALAYGLVCLAMAYIASLMGSVLQVRDSHISPADFCFS